jgi:signal transduction histidine kinase/CheY-like chemotaxis protein
MAKNNAQGYVNRLPAEYKTRFESERLSDNIIRMRGLAIYMVALQVFLQLMNGIFPVWEGNGMSVPVTAYIFMSLITLVIGIIYWVLLTLAKRDRIQKHGAKAFLVQSILYIFVVIQMIYLTMNVLSIQGLLSVIIMWIMVGLVPILPRIQSIITVSVSFIYTIALMLVTQNITDSKTGYTSWENFFFTDMRANLIIVAFMAVFSSALVYRLYSRNFIKTVELERANDGLEQTVRERTAELEKQTIAAQAASRAKTRFLGSMSHEIRTPLNAVIGMAEVAKNSLDGKRTLSAIAEIEAASSELLTLVNDVLEIAKIDIGDVDLQIEKFDFQRTMKEISAIIIRGCSEKNVSFESNVESIPELIVIGDRAKLRQALIYILNNAVLAAAATPNGRVSFNIDAKQENDTLAARFVIADSGAAYTEEDVKTLFEPFENSADPAAQAKGTGFGLSISQSLVQLMGGEITLGAQENGSPVFNFVINLPIDNAHIEAVSTCTPDLAGRKILIVDDIEMNRVVLTSLIAETKAEVIEAVDGDNAVEIFTASEPGSFEFIFMDIMMPSMDGNLAAQSIRALDRPDAKTVPIVALSANAYPEDVDLSIKSGMNEHIAKPIDREMIMGTLSKYML